MNKKLLSLIAFYFIFVSGFGQVANYTFSQTSGSYLAFTGISNASWDDFVSDNNIPIGFSFNFNGIDYDTCSVNSNGYITFGITVSSDIAYFPISSNAGYAGSISALGMDLVSFNAALTYSTIGTAPNRIFVIQWTNVQRYEGRKLRNGSFNFQIRLNESTNVVQVVFGACVTTYTTDLMAQVGLRGSTNADYNNRIVLNNWSSSTPGTINTATCITGSAAGKLPGNGLTYTWTPKPIITDFTPQIDCAASGTPVVITGRNFTGVTAVKFNGVDAVFTVNSSTQITTLLPNIATTGVVSVTNSSGMAISSSVLTVNPNKTVGIASSSPTSCINTVLTDITHSTTGATGIGAAINLPAGLSAVWSLNTITISGTPTTSGTFNYSIPLTGGCGTANAVGTITVNPPSVGGTVSGGTTVCSGINSTVLTLSGHTGAVVRWESSLDNFATAGSTIANTSTTLTAVNLSATISYRAVLQVGACAATTSGKVTVIVETNTWKVISGVAQWEKGMPNINQSLVFEENYNQNVNLEGCSCEVKSGNITIKDGKIMALTNELKVFDGTLTFENNASLVQINDFSNTGNIIYKRNTAKVKRYDYTYWSSPVKDQTLYNLSPNTLFDKYYGFDPVAGWVLHYNGAHAMEVGKGYIIRASQNLSISDAIVDTAPQFVGVPNNGVIKVSVVPNKFYLLGNPYPSAINAEKFLEVNSNDVDPVLNGTIYFWTHNSPPSNAVVRDGDGIYNYTTNDYASYNRTGSVATAVKDSDPNDPNDNNNLRAPNGTIAAGQAFFVTSSNVGGMVRFDNTMRKTEGNPLDNSQFFKLSGTSKSKSTTAIEKNRVWLNLTNAQGAFKQTLVGYVTGATNDYDTAFDGESFDGNEFIDFYSFNRDKNLTIQGRALPFEKLDEVPLGYRTTITGIFSIAVDQSDGLFSTQNVFLEDKMLVIIHNLKESSYNFTTEKGVFNDRFVLRYSDKTLGTGDFESQEKIIVVFKEKNELKIKSEFETMKRVTVFDLLGKKVFEETLKDVNEFRTSNITLKNQIVIVKILLTNGKIVAKKVSY